MAKKRRRRRRGLTAHQKRFGKVAKACWAQVRNGRLTRKQVPKCIRKGLAK